MILASNLSACAGDDLLQADDAKYYEKREICPAA